MRRLGWIALVVFLSLAVAAAAAVFARIPLATALVEHRLEALGLGEARFTLGALERDRLLVTDIRIGDAIRVKHLAAGYSLRGLLSRRIDRVALEGVRVDLTGDGPLPRPPAASPGTGGGAGWSVTAASLKDAWLRLPGPDGAAIEAAAEANLRMGGNGAAEGEARLDVSGAPGRFVARLAGERAADGAMGGVVTVEDGRWRQAGVALDGLSGSIRLGTAPPSGRAMAGQVAVKLAVARIETAGARLGDVALSLPLGVMAGLAEITFALSAPGSLEAGSVTVAGAASRQKILAVLEAADAPLLVATRAGDGWAAAFALVVAVSEFVLEVAREGAAAEAAVVAPGRIAVSAALKPGEGPTVEAAVKDAALGLSGRQLALGGVSATLSAMPAEGRAVLLLGGGELRSSAASPVFAPLALDGEAVLAEGRVTFRGAARAAAAPARIVVDGTHRLADGSGKASLRTDGFDFAPGGLQPAALSPLLSPLSAVRGGVRARAALRWPDPGAAGTAEVMLDALSFTVAGLAVEGVDGGAVFSGLLPPATQPGQSLRIRRIGAGVPVDDVSIRFGLPGDGDRLVVEAMEASVVGGRLGIADAVFTPEGSVGAVILRVRGLALSQLFDALGLDDVSGSGALDGDVPLRITRAGIAIEAGALAAPGEGRLSIRSEQVRAALRAGGEQAALLVRALEDFRYDTLALSLDKALDGETRVTLSLGGHNPDVLDGHPFRLNVNLDTNLDKLLVPLLEGYRLWGETLGDIIAPGR